MISKNPFNLQGKKSFTREGLLQAIRISIIAELDAINLYEQFAEATLDDKVREVFLDIAKEEKTHVGEFLELLKMLDEEQKSELDKGEDEVKEIMS